MESRATRLTAAPALAGAVRLPALARNGGQGREGGQMLGPAAAPRGHLGAEWRGPVLGNPVCPL